MVHYETDETVTTRDDVARTYPVQRSGASSMLAGLALALSIVALILAWMAYDRTGADLDERIQQGANQSAESVNDAANSAGDALDAGPDGVDEDDTDMTTPTTP